MSTLVLVGTDTIKINARLLKDFPHGTVAKVSYATDIAVVKGGKNGNTVFASNQSGNVATFELSVLRGSDDDKYLNTQLKSYVADPTAFVLLTGELVKRLGDGSGNITADSYILTGGVFTKQVEGASNVEGDTEQAISKYTMQFAVAPRAIG